MNRVEGYYHFELTSTEKVNMSTDLPFDSKTEDLLTDAHVSIYLDLKAFMQDL